VEILYLQWKILQVSGAQSYRNHTGIHAHLRGAPWVIGREDSLWLGPEMGYVVVHGEGVFQVVLKGKDVDHPGED
jgi:hypothetical protein